MEQTERPRRARTRQVRLARYRLYPHIQPRILVRRTVSRSSSSAN